MEVPLRIFLLFLLLKAVTADLDTDDAVEVNENTRDFILEQNREMRRFLNGEMEKLFAGLAKSFDEKVAVVGKEVEDSILKLAASFHQNLSSLDSKMERSQRNLTEEFSGKLSTTLSNVEVSLAVLSESFDGELQRRDSNVSGELVSLNETLLKNHQQLSRSLVNLASSFNSTPLGNGSANASAVGRGSDDVSTQPHVLTEVEEVNLDDGTIEFCGGGNLHLRRKIWVLRSEGGDSFRRMRFQLEENGLREETRLSLWGSHTGNHVLTGTQSNWREERVNWGHVFLVTLLVSPGGAETPSFKLTFTTTAIGRDRPYSSEVLRGEGRGVVSFPPNNTHTYPPDSEFVAVVAPPSGGPFGLTLTFLDIPATPPRCEDTSFDIHFLKETPTEEPYELLPPSAFTRCGSNGDTSEPLGNFTVVIVRFDVGRGRVGRGFRLEIN